MRMIKSMALLLAGSAAFLGSAQDTPAEIHGAPVQQKRAEILWTRAICKQPGRYIGWATACLRKNGELLAVFSGDRDEHVCPFGKVQMISSKDFGETWSKERNICNTQLDDRDAGIVELPNGDLVVAWFTSVAYMSSIRDRGKLKPGSPQFYWWLHDEKLPPAVKEEWLGYYTARSTDGGKTWEDPVRTYGSANHGPIVLKDGRLLMVGRCRIGDGTSAVWKEKKHELPVEESRDNGRSWQVIAKIEPTPPDEIGQFHEPHLVETDDGRLVAQFRFHAKPAPGQKRRDESECKLRQAESSDGGKTWTRMAPTEIQGYPPHLLKLRDGKLLTVYGRRRPAFGEYACLSDDHGRTWDVANEIKLAGHFNGDLGYPASVQLPDGAILTVYYQAEQQGEKTCLMATKWRVK
ncbi:MAG: sialidase family protein [Kiritimatiellae bacterium]|nr:sialidase family protein [Kiritimatiellia bacterium]